MDCNFCGARIPKGSEVIYVTKKGKALYFCSSKCDRNMVGLERKARKTKWTEEYRREKDARLKLLAKGLPPEKVKDEPADVLEEEAEAEKPEEQPKKEHKREEKKEKAKPKKTGK